MLILLARSLKMEANEIAIVYSHFPFAPSPTFPLLSLLQSEQNSLPLGIFYMYTEELLHSLLSQLIISSN